MHYKVCVCIVLWSFVAYKILLSLKELVLVCAQRYPGLGQKMCVCLRFSIMQTKEISFTVSSTLNKGSNAVPFIVSSRGGNRSGRPIGTYGLAYLRSGLFIEKTRLGFF